MQQNKRVQGQVLEAMNLYDCAIANAAENRYIQEESLANERAALFYLELGKTKIAKTYMTEVTMVTLNGERSLK